MTVMKRRQHKETGYLPVPYCGEKDPHAEMVKKWEDVDCMDCLIKRRLDQVMKIHMEDGKTGSNLCHAGVSKDLVMTTGDWSKVTCKMCLKYIPQKFIHTNPIAVEMFPDKTEQILKHKKTIHIYHIMGKTKCGLESAGRECVSGDDTGKANCYMCRAVMSSEKNVQKNLEEKHRGKRLHFSMPGNSCLCGSSKEHHGYTENWDEVNCVQCKSLRKLHEITEENGKKFLESIRENQLAWDTVHAEDPVLANHTRCGLEGCFKTTKQLGDVTCGICRAKLGMVVFDQVEEMTKHVKDIGESAKELLDKRTPKKLQEDFLARANIGLGGIIGDLNEMLDLTLPRTTKLMLKGLRVNIDTVRHHLRKHGEQLEENNEC